MEDYIKEQFKRLGNTPFGIISLQICTNDGKTNYLNITEEELNKIKAILIKGEL